MTGPNKKIPYLHLFITVKRGTKKSDVRGQLQDKFKCNAKEYFELLQEPKRKPKVKYLADSNDESSTSPVSGPSAPSPGAGVVAIVDKKYTVPDRLRVPEENERDDVPEKLATGTLTMFCCKEKQHYALTCLHVGSANDGDSLPGPYPVKSSDQISAMTKTYLFTHDKVENNNEGILFRDDGRSYAPLGKFYKGRSDSECDILALKISDETEVNCQIADVPPPNWDNIWDELLENVESIGGKQVKVEKTGFVSALTSGHIVSCHASHEDLRFKNAIAVKAESSRPFLESGDSGALVLFHDKNNMKQIFAYGVCEVDELYFPKQNESRSSDDSDSEGSSIWSREDSSCGSKEDVFCSEDEQRSEAMVSLNKDEKTVLESKQGAEIRDKKLCQQDNECVDEFEQNKEDNRDEEIKRKGRYEKRNEHDDDSECGRDRNDVDDESDKDILFVENCEENVSKRGKTGPYFICLRLDTALQKLGLDEAACVDDCAQD